MGDIRTILLCVIFKRLLDLGDEKVYFALEEALLELSKEVCDKCCLDGHVMNRFSSWYEHATIDDLLLQYSNSKAKGTLEALVPDLEKLNLVSQPK